MEEYSRRVAFYRQHSEINGVGEGVGEKIPRVFSILTDEAGPIRKGGEDVAGMSCSKALFNSKKQTYVLGRVILRRGGVYR